MMASPKHVAVHIAAWQWRPRARARCSGAPEHSRARGSVLLSERELCFIPYFLAHPSPPRLTLTSPSQGQGAETDVDSLELAAAEMAAAAAELVATEREIIDMR